MFSLDHEWVASESIAARDGQNRIAMLRAPAARALNPATEPARPLPRGHLFDEMFSPVYDESSLDAAPAALRLMNQQVPPWVQLALEVHRRRDEYDAIVTWGERLTLALMAIQSLTRQGKPHVPMYVLVLEAQRAAADARLRQEPAAIVTWTSVQRRYAIEELGFAPEKIHLVKHYVDQIFWSPRERPAEIICSVGREMRDYDTLIEALRGTCPALPHRGRPRACEPQSPRAPAGQRPRVRRPSRPQRHRRSDAASQPARAAPRDVSLFVVVPLLESDTDNGVTVILEAMAMGKTVICSRTEGQVDVIQDGVTGLYVRQGDPAALRAAMVALWNDPARARAMGARARSTSKSTTRWKSSAATSRRGRGLALAWAFVPGQAPSCCPA